MQAQGADLVLQRMADDSLYMGIFQSLLGGRNVRRSRKPETGGDRWRKTEMFKGMTRKFFSRKICITLQCFRVEIAFGVGGGVGLGRVLESGPSEE